MIDSEWLKLRADKALELLVRRLESAAYAEPFRPVLPHLRDALTRICQIIGVMEPPVPPDRHARPPLDPVADTSPLDLSRSSQRCGLG